MSFAIAAQAKPPTCRWRTTMPARRSNWIATSVLAKLKPLAGKPRNPKSSARTSSTTGTCSPTTASRSRGIVDDTLLQSYVLEAHKSHELGNLASRHLGLATISYDDVTGKGAEQIGFDQVAIETRQRIRRGGCRHHAARAPALAPQIDASDKLDFVYRAHRDARGARSCSAWSAPACCSTAPCCRQSGELGRKMLELEQRAYQEAGQPFNLGSPKQIRRSCSTERPAGRQEDAERRAVHRRGSAGATGARLSHRPSDCSNIAAWPS